MYVWYYTLITRHKLRNSSRKLFTCSVTTKTGSSAWCGVVGKNYIHRLYDEI